MLPPAKLNPLTRAVVSAAQDPLLKWRLPVMDEEFFAGGLRCPPDLFLLMSIYSEGGPMKLVRALLLITTMIIAVRLGASRTKLL